MWDVKSLDDPGVSDETCVSEMSCALLSVQTIDTWLVTLIMADHMLGYWYLFHGFGWKLRDPLLFDYFSNLLIHSYTQLHMKCLSYPFQNYKHVLFLKFAASKSIPKIHCIFSFHTKNLRQKNTVGKSSGIPPIGSAPTCKKKPLKRGRSGTPNPLLLGPGAPFTSL